MSRVFRFSTLLLIVLISLFGCVWLMASDPNTADELALVREGARVATSAITSGRGDVTVRKWYAKEAGAAFETESKYTVVFAGDKFNYRVIGKYLQNTPDPGEDPTRLVAPSTEVTRSVSYDGVKVVSFQPAKGEAEIRSPGSGGGRNDIDTYAALVSMLSHGLGSLDPSTPLPSSVVSTIDPHIVGHEVVDGSDCVIVEVGGTAQTSKGERLSSRKRMWIDPTKGFTQVRVRTWLQGGSNQEFMNAETIRTVREYAPGIWGPATEVRTKYRLDSTGATERFAMYSTTFDEGFKVNVLPDESELRLQLPSGTIVKDDVLNAEYATP